jgi:hypothetical protein
MIEKYNSAKKKVIAGDKLILQKGEERMIVWDNRDLTDK